MKPGERAGITPVVAIVLLLMMTVAASGGAYAWMQQVQNEAQDDASETLATGIAVRDIRCEGSVAVITVKNTGDTALTGGTADVYLSDDEALIGTSTVDLTGAAVLQPGGLTTAYIPFEIGMADGMRHTVELRMPDGDVTVSAPCQASSGLISYYRFDEGSGTWANDSVGSYDARLRNGSNVCTGGACPTWTAGVRGSAVDLDGAYDGVIASWEPTTDRSITYAAWYQRDGGDGVLLGANPVCHSGPSLYVSSGGDLTFEARSADDTCATASTAGSAGSWIHAVGVADADTGEVRLYLNGSLVDQAQGWDGNMDGGTIIGIDEFGSPEYDLDGRIDEMQVHGRALSTSQVEALYEATKPG